MGEKIQPSEMPETGEEFIEVVGLGGKIIKYPKKDIIRGKPGVAFNASNDLTLEEVKPQGEFGLPRDESFSHTPTMGWQIRKKNKKSSD